MKKIILGCVLTGCVIGAQMTYAANTAAANNCANVTPIPVSQVESLVQKQGYKNIRMIVLSNCTYKVRAMNQNNQRVKLILDAATGKVIGTQTLQPIFQVNS